jgi:hypothetical protein
MLTLLLALRLLTAEVLDNAAIVKMVSAGTRGSSDSGVRNSDGCDASAACESPRPARRSATTRSPAGPLREREVLRQRK